MSTKTSFKDRFFAALLSFMLIVSMIPLNAITAFAATEEYPDSFTVTVKDTGDTMIDGASIDYSIKVDGAEQANGSATTVAGVAVIAEMAGIDMSDPSVVVTFSATVSKIGYDDATVTDEVVTEINGNVDVVLNEKETVNITISVKDSVENTAVNDADVAITGYTSSNGTTANGVFVAELYKDETYTISVTKKGYKSISAPGLTFAASDTYDVALIAKLVDDTLAFSEATPANIEYGDTTFVNTAASTLRTGTITYSVESGESVTVNASTGALTTLKAGTSTIKALLAEDDDYQESEATYQITVTNAPDAGFGFADPTPANRKYEENGTYSNIASGGNGTGAITYAISSGDAATINAETGELTIVKTGTVEVTATRAADDKYAEITATYTLTIEKADQSALVFDVLSPEDQFITNGSYTNTATGGSGTGAITYSIVSGDEYATITDPTSPLVTFIKVGGPIVVKATRAADDNYEETSAQYTFHIKKSPQTEMLFETSSPTIVYAPDLTYSNPLTGGSGTGEVSYEILSGDAATINPAGVLSIVKSGTVVVKATKASDDNYEEQTAQFTLTIEKAEQTGFAFADGNSVAKTWSPDANTYANIASGGQSTGEITYTVVGTIGEMPFGGPCAAFDVASATVTMYGKGAITIKAVKAGDDCYEPIEAQYTLTISRATQTGFDFDPSVPTSLTYNDNNNVFDLATVGGNGAGDVSYAIKSGDSVTINGNKVTVVKSGTVQIEATKAATNTYEAATATIEITIAKADQAIEFEDKTTTSIVYGNEFANAAHEVVVSTVPDGKGYAALTTITYTITTGTDIASVDADGKLTFKNNKTGTVTVKASKAGDDCYNATEATYTIDVVFANVPETSYTLSGDKINESGWYTGDVTITPATGYQISESNALTGNTWSDNIVVSSEGYNGKTIYLKGAEGISDAIVIPENDIRIDKSTPKNLSINYSTSVLDAILETITFGFYKAPVTVTIEATDDVSHIASFEYTYGENNGTISTGITYSDEDKVASASFEISAQFRGKVSITAIDVAGNTAELHDDKVIIVDDIAPGVAVSFDNNNAENGTYYKANRTATITIDEANYFADAFEQIQNTADETVDEHLVITVTKETNDGTTTTTVFKNADLTSPFTENAEGKWVATLLFDEDADYTLEIEYKDFSGNSAAKYETAFTIDKIQPIISIAYDNNEAQNGNYYNDNRVATLTVVEHNFRQSDVVVESLTSLDVQGNVIDLTTDYQDQLINGTWNQDGDTYTIDLTLDTDAKYNFVISYTDLAGNAQVETITDEFTVDKVAPDNLKISYGTSVMDTVLQAITFGFYDAPVTVTITADDSVSGIDYFTYSYGVQVGASSTNVGKGDTVIGTGDITYSNLGKTATATFTIPAQFRGSVSFTATDRAGNTSEALNDTKVIIVDDVAPGVTVSYDANEASNGTFYKTNRTATITINEANFFNEAFEKVENIAVDPSVMIDEHLVITVTKVDNDGVSTTSVIKSADLTTPFTETSEDTWVATLLFDEDADYSWKIEYKDFSGNAAGTFTDAFTIDKIKPVMSISYDNNDVANTDHYKADRTATVQITEHNFRQNDIIVKSISAVDIQGNPVDYSKDYQTLLRTGTWESEGNTHTITIPFDVDARYSFEIVYADMAANDESASITDEFCVDKLAPAKDSLKVSYSTSVIDTILETITFGFYQAPVTVTIEADDSISGIDYFTYSYTVSAGESSTNVGKSNVVIPTGEITYSDNGKHAKATFDIPAQFRGNVSFTATDRSGNTSEMLEDGKVIVVDNVAPGVTVAYDNNSATYETYYKASRTATITIKEANFFVEAFDKVENINVEPSEMIDEHLVITVTKEANDGTKTTNVFKNADLTTPFTKTAEDTWEATLLFAEDADYSWTVEYKDFSGNVAGTFEDAFTVDNIDPEISVAHSNNDAQNATFFKADRPVEIKITEHNFKAEDVVVTVTANQATATVTDYSAYLTNPANWTSNGDVHTANIVFDTEAYYTFDISYTDMAGRSNTPVNYGESVAYDAFTVDKTAPTEADITIDNVSILATNGVAFEKFYRAGVEVKYTVNCDISGLDNIKYQKVDSVSKYDEAATWTDFTGSVKVNPSEKFVIYFRAEDKAGNYTIVNSIGVVVDDKAPIGETNAPQIDITPAAANDNGLHNSDVKVDLKVIDPKYVASNQDTNGYYSGLNKITYKIYTKDTAATEEGVLFDLSDNTDKGKAVLDADKLVKEWTGSITVSAEKFNSNNVIVEIYAVDNAGNERTTKNEDINQPIRIDITAPTIAVSYDNNDGDTAFADATTDAFFKANRVATIVITERNFNPDKVVVTITNTDGVIPELSGWATVDGTGNGDGTTHTATITYSADGDYTFDISYIDQADNANDPVTYTGLATQKFTVDKTLPTINVVYDNNDAQNGNYYKAQRIATLTVVEHNFETSRIQIALTATDNGANSTLPTVSNWTSTGDTHVATITYANDSLYTFDFDYTDKAGNATANIDQQSFYVDKTNPAVSITKIVDESANNDEGNIGYVITATDTNFDVFTPVLTAVVKEGNEFKTKQLDVGTLANINNGKTYTVTNLDADGIYRITCTVVDKAGNAYSEVTLTREDGSTYVEKRAGTDTLLTFSVNRLGSTFELDSKTVDLLSKYYVQNVKDDVVLIEINADPLQEYKVSLNGKTLSESQYKVDHVGGEGNWEHYTYTIDKDLFEAEGEYTVVVSSKDKATNDAFSDVKDASVKFVVDRTAPVVTVTGLAKDGRYQTDKQVVTLVPTDDGGALKSIVVTLVDKDGKEISELLNLSGEDFTKALEEGNGQLTFEVPEGLYQNVRIVCDDEADYGTDDNIIYDETITNVSVANSAFLIFWANKPLRWGSIGGVTAIAAGAAAFIAIRKRKKNIAKAK